MKRLALLAAAVAVLLSVAPATADDTMPDAQTQAITHDGGWNGQDDGNKWTSWRVQPLGHDCPNGSKPVLNLIDKTNVNQQWVIRRDIISVSVQAVFTKGDGQTTIEKVKTAPDQPGYDWDNWYTEDYSIGWGAHNPKLMTTGYEPHSNYRITGPTNGGVHIWKVVVTHVPWAYPGTPTTPVPAEWDVKYRVKVSCT